MGSAKFIYCLAFIYRRLFEQCSSCGNKLDQVHLLQLVGHDLDVFLGISIYCNYTARTLAPFYTPILLRPFGQSKHATLIRDDCTTQTSDYYPVLQHLEHKRCENNFLISLLLNLTFGRSCKGSDSFWKRILLCR